MSSTEQQSAPQKKVLGLAGRGLLMGLAEVVPGVSGGTMAFVTGIYHELVTSLAAFGPGSLKLLLQPKAFYEHHNLRFLLSLALGMLMGILLFAQVMQFLLANYQPLVWAFFSGVIGMSVFVIGRLRAPRALLYWAPLGLLTGLALLWLPPSTGAAGLPQIFFGGALAVCAWLLPAVSGSYVLLALGYYGQVIEAVAVLNWPVLMTLAAGCGAGLLLFARLLSWLLRRFSEALLSFLTGFMLGSILKLWPWQDPAQLDALDRLLSPAAYVQLTAAPAFGFLAAFMVVAGALGLWLVTKLADV